MSLGFEQAGFDVAAAVEIDLIHSAIHKFNFPKTAVLPRSVIGLGANEIRLAGGIGDREVHCVFGGPPCQGFSLIGQRALDDPRNRLVLEFVRLVSELKAHTFVFENVKGITVGEQKSVLNELVADFDSAGYAVRLPWQVLDAAHFGVPQHRERLILLGARKGLPLPEYPLHTTNPADAAKWRLGLPLGPTCADALSDLPNADEFPGLLETDQVYFEPTDFGTDYARQLRGLSADSWHFGYPRNWNPGILTSSARTVHSAISKQRFLETGMGGVEPISRFFKLPADGLSNTLRAGTDGSRGAFTSPRPIHFAYPRCITVREMARLHGFPDWFRFHATKWHGARQIGNSVAPPLARSIAASVLKGLGMEPSRVNEAIDLGNPELVSMAFSKAANEFGTRVASPRRDRKSLHKKRSQRETENARLGSIVAHD